MKKTVRIISWILGVIGLLVTADLAANCFFNASAVFYHDLALYVNVVWGIWTLATFVFAVTLFFKRKQVIGWFAAAVAVVCLGFIGAWIGPLDAHDYAYVGFLTLGILHGLYVRKMNPVEVSGK